MHVRARLPFTRCIVPAAVVLLSTTMLSRTGKAADAQDLSGGVQHKRDSAASAGSTTKKGEAISVVGNRRSARGGGLMVEQTAPISQSTVTSEFIGTQAATENPYQAIELAPGAAVANGDPYGISNQQGITIRGLAGNQTGEIWEGMPVNDIEAYGGYPTYWADGEDIGSVSLVPGSTDIDTPVITSAGGYTSTNFKDPDLKPGGLIDYTYGNYRTQRVFARLESGLIGNTGLRAFASYSDMGTDNSDGPGRNRRQHVDFEVAKDTANGSTFRLAGSFSDVDVIDNPKPTLQNWEAYGRGNVRDADYTYGDTNYYLLNKAPWRQFMMSAPSHVVVDNHLSFDVTPYFLYADGNSPGGDVLSTTGNYFGTSFIDTLAIPNSQDGEAAVMADYVSVQSFGGLNASGSYRFNPHNTLRFGWWYQYSLDQESIPYSPISLAGAPTSVWGDNFIRTSNGSIYYSQADHTVTQINTLYLQDDVSLLDDRLHISPGFRAEFVDRAGTNGLPGPQYGLGGNYFEPLPRLTVDYRISPTSQIFANVMTSSVMPTDDTLYDNYSGGSISTQGNPNLKPEYAISEEIGYRYHDQTVNASATFFNYNFTNRQLSSLEYIDGVQINSSINAGGETTRGVDAEIGLRPIYHFSPYASFEYLHATTDNNLAAGTDYIQSAGKAAPDAPSILAAAGLRYDDGRFFGMIDVRYTGSQYSTFMEDEKMPSYVSSDLSVGYRLPKLPVAGHVELRLNVVNLGGARYLSGIASTALNAKSTTGVYGTQITGSSPSYYIGPATGVMFTVTDRF